MFYFYFFWQSKENFGKFPNFFLGFSIKMFSRYVCRNEGGSAIRLWRPKPYLLLCDFRIS